MLDDHKGRHDLVEHALCTLGGVKSDRAHFVGGGRYNLLLRALRLISIKKILVYICLFVCVCYAVVHFSPSL